MHDPCTVRASFPSRIFSIRAPSVHRFLRGFSLSVHRPCIVSFEDFQYPCIVRASFPSRNSGPCIVRASFPSRNSGACIVRASFPSRNSGACIVRASFPSRIFSIRASTPYGYYNIIRGGGGCPGSRRPLRIAISIVVTDGLQTVWCLSMARDVGFGAAVAAWQLAWQPVGGQTRTKTS